MKRRHFILLCGGASSGLMSVGTGAFSSMKAERGVSVEVVNDKKAFVRYETPSDGKEVDSDERITLVRIQNQFGSNQQIGLVGVEIHGDYNVLDNIAAERKLSDHNSESNNGLDENTFKEITDVAIKKGSDINEFPDPDENDAFGPAGVGQVVADTDLDPGQEATIKITITVKGIEGTGVAAQIFGDTRSFTIEGAGPDEIEGVTFNGKRNANADGASGDYTLDLWFVKDGDATLEDGIQQDRHWNGNGNVNSGDAGDNSEVKNRRLLAVRFKQTEQTFYRPGYGIDKGDVPWSVENFIEGTESGNSGGNENENANSTDD